KLCSRPTQPAWNRVADVEIRGNAPWRHLVLLGWQATKSKSRHMAGQNSRRASSPGSLLTGIVLGSGAAWLLDARSGRRRRMQLRDAAVHAAHAARRAADRTSRDIGNRARGTLAAGRGMFQSSSAPDEVIAQRVRSQLGRVVSHPDAIEAHSIDGEVTLSGPVLRDEVSALLSRVRGVRGVRAVVDKLEVHEEAGKIPDLQ